MVRNINRKIASMASSSVADALGGKQGIDDLKRLLDFWAETDDRRVPPGLIDAAAMLMGHLDTIEDFRQHRREQLKCDVLAGRRAKRIKKRNAPGRPRIAAAGQE